ncbi:MAG: triose-phosphate isomerase [Verrucomicrobiales bacterium]|jgi:triosephosphate isomerase|nr:triose-phosphate isomerase [Verrucomicrobiales bacterium]
MIRKKIIAGNWKMNKTTTETKTLVLAIKDKLGKFDQVEVVICPPFTALQTAQEALGSHSDVALGAQNLHQAAGGAYTGEISAAMLRDLFCRYVILGHSERRQYFAESDALVNEKARVALKSNLRPIICVGETLAEREAGHMATVVTAQTKGSCAGFSKEDWNNVVIAYEPVWAIGTGKTATPAQAQEVHALIRKTIKQITGKPIADKLRIQYGGSVKPDNARELLNQPDIDGALVGGASLDAESFVAIIKNSVAT